MGGFSYFFDGLDEWEASLTKAIEHDYPDEFKQLVITIALELQATVKDRTPVDTSHLQDEWKVGDITQNGSHLYIEVYNITDYVEHVEYGHRKRNSEELVPGAHMMEISIAMLEARMTPYLQNWLSNFLDTHELV